MQNVEHTHYEVLSENHSPSEAYSHLWWSSPLHCRPILAVRHLFLFRKRWPTLFARGPTPISPYNLARDPPRPHFGKVFWQSAACFGSVAHHQALPRDIQLSKLKQYLLEKFLPDIVGVQAPWISLRQSSSTRLGIFRQENSAEADPLQAERPDLKLLQKMSMLHLTK